MEVGEKWNPELRSAIRGFRRLLIWGGEDWEGCVDAYLAFERAWGFPGKGFLAAPGESLGRPKAVAVFMRDARRWGIPTELGFDAVGPREDASSFAHEWWGWWKLLQPKTRDWDELAKTHGRNGMLMVMGCLLWWGDVAEESDDPLLESDWKSCVRDVLWALKECVVGVGELQKRIEAENKETKEKEKAAKKKRAEEEALVKKQRAEKRKTSKAQAAGPKAKK
ncbi:hypothetical protein B0H14DRAFT_3510964 [Mycena olivaceomarginata]|nr:hypothetical protein B0H14DRAFT_3510964 [Mycena olivaceomarginata]